MTANEMEATILNLNALALDQAGELAAQRAMISAVIAAVGQADPTTLSLVAENIEAMGAATRSTLPEQALTVFDDTLNGIQRGLAAMLG
jgi:hypothetical protein